MKINNTPANAGDINDMGSIPGLGRSPGEGQIFTYLRLIFLLFTHSVVSNSLQSHGLQHTRLPWWLSGKQSTCQCRSQGFDPSIRIFSNESASCIRWLKYWSFNFSISSFKEYSGLISLRIDWFDLLQPKGLSRVFSSTTV